MAGPKNKGAVNLDTYDASDSFMPAGTPASPKQINPADAKTGPRKGKAGHINPDTYNE